MSSWYDDFSSRDPFGRFFDDFDRYRPFGVRSRLRREFDIPSREIPSSRTATSAATSSSDTDKRLSVTKDGIQMHLNVYQFTPSEITVKTVDDVIIIEGKHEEKQDEHGYVTRQFTRRYKLPKEYDPKDVITTMSADGVLTIKAPAIAKPEPVTNERVITIQHTGPAATSPAEKKENPSPLTEEMK